MKTKISKYEWFNFRISFLSNIFEFCLKGYLWTKNDLILVEWSSETCVSSATTRVTPVVSLPGEVALSGDWGGSDITAPMIEGCSPTSDQRLRCIFWECGRLCCIFYATRQHSRFGTSGLDMVSEHPSVHHSILWRTNISSDTPKKGLFVCTWVMWNCKSWTCDSLLFGSSVCRFVRHICQFLARFSPCRFCQSATSPHHLCLCPPVCY